MDQEEDRKQRKAGEPLPDGGRLRVSMLAMDAVQRAIAATSVIDAYGRPAGHAPGFCFGALTPPVPVPDENPVADARAAYLDRLTNAWRPPNRDACPAADQQAEDRYDSYKERLENAWKRT